jgi:protein-S-isoprenylcysteine O-methyltransferase Ste14
MGKKGEGYVIIQFLLFALIGLGPKSVAWLPQWSASTWLIGLIVGGVGMGLVIAGIFSLGTNLTAVPHPKENSNLVETGAYKIVRHPIYSGILIGAIGYGLLNRSPLILLYTCLLFILFDIKSRREEAWLVEKFPTYSQYQQRVSKLIPFLY